MLHEMTLLARVLVDYELMPRPLTDHPSSSTRDLHLHTRL